MELLHDRAVVVARCGKRTRRLNRLRLRRPGLRFPACRHGDHIIRGAE
jgi:hypothetical protein